MYRRDFIYYYFYLFDPLWKIGFLYGSTFLRRAKCEYKIIPVAHCRHDSLTTNKGTGSGCNLQFAIPYVWCTMALIVDFERSIDRANLCQRRMFTSIKQYIDASAIISNVSAFKVTIVLKNVIVVWFDATTACFAIIHYHSVVKLKNIYFIMWFVFSILYRHFASMTGLQ